MMHQELSRREKLSMVKLGITILVAAVILITLNTILVNFQLNSSLTDLIIIMSTAVLTFVFIKQNMISYKYCLIEDEFIVSEVLGSKEKRILNLNLYQIISFANVRDDSYDKDKGLQMASRKKLYNCINRHNRHYMIYEDGEDKRWITIQPSDYMIRLIKDKLAES